MIFLRHHKKYCSSFNFGNYSDCQVNISRNVYYDRSSYDVNHHFYWYEYHFYSKSYRFVKNYDFIGNDYLLIEKHKYRIEIRLTKYFDDRTFNIIFTREFKFKCSGYDN